MIELILLTSIATTPLPLPNSVITPVSPLVTAPHTPADSRVNQDRPPINTPQTPPTGSRSETWEEKMLRRYRRKGS